MRVAASYLPEIRKYPDLEAQMNYQLRKGSSAPSRGCGGCDVSKILRTFRARLDAIKAHESK